MSGEMPPGFALYYWCDHTDPRCDVKTMRHMHHQDQVWLNHRNAGHTTNENRPPLRDDLVASYRAPTWGSLRSARQIDG